MNVVEPIKDKDLLHNLIGYLRDKNERNYILFLMGIYTGLRISDILNLRVGDVQGRRNLNIRDSKTNKINRIEFNTELKKALDQYSRGRNKNEYLIRSRNGKNKPITRGQAYKILRAAAKEYGIDNIGVHSMRKTFGFHLYDLTKDIVQVQLALNHGDATHTKRYIGIDRETVNQSIKRLRF